MCCRRAFLPRLLRLSFLTALCLLASAIQAQLLQLSGATPASTDAPPTTVTLTLTQGGTLDRIQVLSGGSPGYDFSDLGGGSCVQGTAYLAGQNCTVQLGFHPVAPGERRGAVVLLDRNGGTLASRFVAGSASGPLGTFVPGTMSTVAGNQAWIYAGDGNPATASSIFLPFGFAVNAAGDLFIADSGNNRIRRVDGSTQVISTIAGTGVIGATGDGGPALAATLSDPVSVALDAAGNIYFSDSGNNIVRRIDAATGLLHTVAGTPGSHGYTGDLGPATSATLNNPNGITVDASGNLYIADTANHVIRRVDRQTGIISSVAGRGFPAFSGDGGPAVSAGLNSPWSLTRTAAGEFYIADQGNHRIRRIDPTGTISTVMGTGAAGSGGDNGPATAAQLNVPSSVAVDIAGNIYVADSGNNRVRKILRASGEVLTVAGNSGEAFEGDDGPANLAGLYGPYTLALDDAGDLFIADVFHNRIRKVLANAATLQFPPMRVGRVASALQQTLENDGNAPLNPAALRATLESQLSPALTTCSVDAAVAPLDQCVLSVQFAPTATGERVKGLFNLDSDAANSPAAIALVGKVLDVDPSTIAVTSSANPSTTGAPVTFSVQVTSDGTTPTGQITLFDGANSLATAQLGAGGLGSFTVSSLLGGQHDITVAYAGDASNSASLSVVLLQVVKDVQAATATVLTSNSNPVVAGASVTLTAAVSAVTAGAGNGAISGVFAFKEGVNQLGTAQISNGTATLTVSTLPVGSHTLVAVYAGNSNYAASTSASLSQAVLTATTRVVLTSAANPSVSGAPLVLTANVSGNGGIPGGQVNFTEGGQSLGSGTLNAQGTATLQVPGPHWTPGAHTLSAAYTGDAADGISTAQPLLQTVTLAQTQTLLTASSNPVAQGGPVTLTALVSGNGGIPGGTVQFLDGAAVIGSAALDARGTASFTTDKLSLATHPLTASYGGDPLDAGSVSPALQEQVQPATVAIVMGSSGNPGLFGAALTLTAQVSGSGAKPVGTVLFRDGSSTLGSATLDAAGNASMDASSLSIGAHTLTAQYSGDADHPVASSAPYAQQILQNTSTTVALSAGNSVAGLPVTVTATTLGSSGQPLGGEVILSDGLAELARLTPVNGVVSFSTTKLAVGQHQVIAAYSGDALDAASKSAPAGIAVAQAVTQTRFSTGSNPSFAGDPLQLAVTVTGNGANPDGSVNIMDGGQILVSLPLTSGSAQTSVSSLAPGLHTLKAVYLGTSQNGASESGPVTEQIAQKTSVTVTSSANPSLLPDAVTVTVAVSNGVPGSPPSGQVTLFEDGSVAGSGTLAGGLASFPMAALTVGSHTLTARYAGDNSNTPADSAPMVQVVMLRPTVTSLTVSTTALSAGQPVVMVSVVEGAGTRRPEGTVSFQAGATVLGTAAVDANGIATLSATPPEQVYNLLAVYSGDALFATSSSPVIKLTVGPTVEFTLAVSQDAMTMQSGQHGSLGVSITTAKTFVDTVAFGCAGLPAYATCTFSEPQVTAGGGLPHSLTLTVDTGAPLGAGATAGVMPQGTAAAFACSLPGAALLLLLLPLRRRVLRLLLCLLALAAVPMLGGCGSSFSVKSTPPGAFRFQIVATGNTTHATNTASVQLKVTP